MAIPAQNGPVLAPGDYRGLTAAQAKLLSYLRVQQDLQYTPSYQEMADAIGLRAKSGVHRLITALIERGYASRLQNRARAIEVFDTRREEDVLQRVPTDALVAELRRRGLRIAA